MKFFDEFSGCQPWLLLLGATPFLTGWSLPGRSSLSTSPLLPSLLPAESSSLRREVERVSDVVKAWWGVVGSGPTWSRRQFLLSWLMPLWLFGFSLFFWLKKKAAGNCRESFLSFFLSSEDGACLSNSSTCVYSQSFSHIQLSVAPWTVTLQAPLSLGFPRQGY